MQVSISCKQNDIYPTINDKSADSNYRWLLFTYNIRTPEITRLYIQAWQLCEHVFYAAWLYNAYNFVYTKQLTYTFFHNLIITNL